MMRLVMFDLDGTLVDSGALIFEHMTTTFRTHGLAIPSEAGAHSIIGLSLEMAMVRLAGCDEATAHMLAATYRKEYRAMIAKGERHEPLYAGARAAVERLAAGGGHVLGIATGKGLSGLRRVLDLHALAPHFITLQTPDHNPSKPHPGMLLRAMEETGVGPRATVMIGDTTFDMETARSAGARAIGVTWGYHARADLEEAGADIIIEDYSQLDDAIEKVLS